MSNEQTRAEMYRTVREFMRLVKRNTDAFNRATRALAALETGERDGRDAIAWAYQAIGAQWPNAEALDNLSAISRGLPPPHEWPVVPPATPPAPPAAECAAQRSGFWLIYFEDNEMPVEIFTDKEAACERYHTCLLNWTCHLFEMIAPAALAAPCECQRLREELAKCHSVNEAVLNQADRDEELADQYRAELLDAKSEIARLTSDLMLAVAWRKKAIKDRTDAQTELHQAVDAMRPFAKWAIEQDDPRGRSHFVRYADCIPVAESSGVNATFGDFRISADFVVAYDAKYGESKEPDAATPSPEYSGCPRCHVTLYHSATDTHERRHEIREGADNKEAVSPCQAES